MPTLAIEIGFHFMLEALGSLSLLCVLRMCAHEACHLDADGQPLAPSRARRLLTSRRGQFALWAAFTFITSTITVLLIG